MLTRRMGDYYFSRSAPEEIPQEILTSVALPSGDVLIVGGLTSNATNAEEEEGDDDGYAPSCPVFLRTGSFVYSQRDNSWTELESQMQEGRADFAHAVVVAQRAASAESLVPCCVLDLGEECRGAGQTGGSRRGGG